MKRTTMLTMAVFAGWAVAAAAQTSGPADPPKAANEKSQAQKRNETRSRETVEAQNTQASGQRFVDADGDGVCDNCDTRITRHNAFYTCAHKGCPCL